MAAKVVNYHPSVPEGDYTVRLQGYETGSSWNASKAMATFYIVVGDCSGTPLYRYCNVTSIEGDPGKDREFKVGDRSDLVRECRRLLPDLPSIS